MTRKFSINVATELYCHAGHSWRQDGSVKWKIAVSTTTLCAIPRNHINKKIIIKERAIDFPRRFVALKHDLRGLNRRDETVDVNSSGILRLPWRIFAPRKRSLDFSSSCWFLRERTNASYFRADRTTRRFHSRFHSPAVRSYDVNSFIDDYIINTCQACIAAFKCSKNFASFAAVFFRNIFHWASEKKTVRGEKICGKCMQRIIDPCENIMLNMMI